MIKFLRRYQNPRSLILILIVLVFVFEGIYLLRAKKVQRLQLIVYESKSCGTCQKILQDALQRPEIRAVINAHYTLTTADADQDPKVDSQFKGLGVANPFETPLLILKDEHTLLLSTGYLPAPQMLALLKRAYLE